MKKINLNVKIKYFKGDNIELLDFLITDEGVRTLFIAFIPGFISLSCLRHWFGYFKTLKEFEVIFWSIPLSLFLNIVMVTPIAILNPQMETPISSGILAGCSIILFLFLLGMYLKNRKKVFARSVSKMSLFFSIFGYWIMFLIKSEIGNKINGILWYQFGLWRYNLLIYGIISFIIQIILIFVIPSVITYKIFKTKLST